MLPANVTRLANRGRAGTVGRLVLAAVHGGGGSRVEVGSVGCRVLQTDAEPDNILPASGANQRRDCRLFALISKPCHRLVLGLD